MDYRVENEAVGRSMVGIFGAAGIVSDTRDDHFYLPVAINDLVVQGFVRIAHQNYYRNWVVSLTILEKGQQARHHELVRRAKTAMDEVEASNRAFEEHRLAEEERRRAEAEARERTEAEERDRVEAAERARVEEIERAAGAQAEDAPPVFEIEVDPPAA